MTVPARPRALLLIWAALLIGPIAWAASLGTMFWLTDPACQGGSRNSIVITGVICVVLAIGSGLLAGYGSRRYAHDPQATDGGRFLLSLAKGGSAIFALVIALSLVPVAMLSPCPL
jgi:uncharacterized membrane protein YidH (DUF202 family)